MTDTALDNAVRGWAKGILSLEAGAELLIRQGKAIYEGAPWLKTHGPVWEQGRIADLDVDMLLKDSKVWSGAERRVTAVAVSLLEGERVDLSDAMTGLDRKSLALVLAALAHANGSHQDSEIRAVDGELSRVVALPSAYAWPGEGSAVERSRRPVRATTQESATVTSGWPAPSS